MSRVHPLVVAAHHCAEGAIKTSPEAAIELHAILTAFAEKWKAWLEIQMQKEKAQELDSIPEVFKDAFRKEGKDT